MALEQAFDVDTLHELRKAVLAEAAAAGMPIDRAYDVMLAVHELATNAVRHGGGAGRARMRVVGEQLHCLVSDAGARSVDGHAPAGIATPPPPWPCRRGHGLWLVRNVADQVSMSPGLDGSQVTVVFALQGVMANDGRLPAVQVQGERRDRSSVLRITGELDAVMARALAERADAAMRMLPLPVLVDLSGLTFLDAHGARALAAVIQRLTPGRLTGVPPCPPG